MKKTLLVCLFSFGAVSLLGQDLSTCLQNASNVLQREQNSAGAAYTAALAQDQTDCDGCEQPAISQYNQCVLQAFSTCSGDPNCIAGYESLFCDPPLESGKAGCVQTQNNSDDAAWQDYQDLLNQANDLYAAATTQCYQLYPTGGSGDACYVEGEIDCSDPNSSPDFTCYNFYCGGDSCCVQYDPIIIDIEGDGYALTSPSDGVPFDMAGNGQMTKVSWTSMGSGDAFLALDRNGNGKIDDGTELFSNFTPNSGFGSNKNGYNALAFYDRPVNGGNGDGWIDKSDAVFSKLLLWVDKNHNGISESDELFTLPQLGITRISLGYKESKWSDAYGNMFRYRAQVIRDGSGGPAKDHWAYDVDLHAAQ
jgi:hypothetical protein